MSADQLRRYRFASQTQWNSCLLGQVVRHRKDEELGITPFAPFAQPGRLYGSDGAHAPVVTLAGETLWCDEIGRLHRLYRGDAREQMLVAPVAISRATRIVATSSGLWAIGTSPGTIHKYEIDSLTLLLTAELPDSRLVDIASDGRGGVLVLVEQQGQWRSMRIDSAGHVGKPVTFEGTSHITSFTFLRRVRRFVLLSRDPQSSQLHWFPEDGGRAIFSIPPAVVRLCFGHSQSPDTETTLVLGSDSRERVFLAGKEAHTTDGGVFVLIFHEDGTVLGDVPIESEDWPMTGLAASDEVLFVAGRRGLLHFDPAEVVPDGVGPVRCTLITPVLHSPDREDQRRWLRAEAIAHLPEGCTIEISYASAKDVQTRDRIMAVVNKESMSIGQRLSQILNEPNFWKGPTVFHGTDAAGTDVTKSYSAKLFDVGDPYLWVSVTLTAAPGARLPRLTELVVWYPGHTLMEHLPAMYQRDESRPGSFLRGLVGVLEATTQGLDMEIRALGSRIHPSTAPEPWLDFIARWLGVPWDDGLQVQQKRAIVMRAEELTKERGTRAGLELLLACLLPDTPRRFRVIDATADIGFATVGGEQCAGSTLPAMLGGQTPWHAELGSRAVLGSMRLPCAGQRHDGVWHLAGKILVDVAATAAERNTWESWLWALLAEMTPITARLEVRWVSAQALVSQRLDGTMVLTSAPVAHLGSDAQLGFARLPEGGAKLSDFGSSIDTVLG